MSKFLHRIDARALSLSGGRRSVAALATGIPTVLLTTTGARSGAARTSPLVAIPFGSDLALLGTGWGRPDTPSWVHNLTAHPKARIAANGIEIAVSARRAAPAEEELIWQQARSTYRGYASYRARVTGRAIAVFVLSAE